MIRITNGVVSLREFSGNDAPRMAELANNPNVSINLRDAFPNPYTLENAKSFIAMVQSLKPAQVFAIEWKGEYVGNIGVHKKEDVYRKSAEIGYFIGEPYWGKGIMTQAVPLACQYAFENLDIVRIDTGVFSFNVASQRVLEKCGFEKEAVFRKSILKNGQIFDEIRYSLLHSDV